MPCTNMNTCAVAMGLLNGVSFMIRNRPNVTWKLSSSIHGLNTYVNMRDRRKPIATSRKEYIAMRAMRPKCST